MQGDFAPGVDSGKSACVLGDGHDRLAPLRRRPFKTRRSRPGFCQAGQHPENYAGSSLSDKRSKKKLKKVKGKDIYDLKEFDD